jgi:hypothetical protein
MPGGEWLIDLIDGGLFHPRVILQAKLNAHLIERSLACLS